MPNHCTNRLRIKGPLQRVTALLGVGAAPFHEEGKVVNPDFSFRNFIPRPTDIGDGWYNWNVRYWGTKWDAYDVRIERDKLTILDHLVNEMDEPQSEVSIIFDTAWAPPTPVILKIVEDYADLEIEHTYMDEDMMGGGGGRALYVNGELIESADDVNDPEDYEFRKIAGDLKGFDYDEWKKEQEEEVEEEVEEVESEVESEKVE